MTPRIINLLDINLPENTPLNPEMEEVNLIAFRGDTRDPFKHQIFENGFQRKGAGWNYFEKNKRIEEPLLRNWARFNGNVYEAFDVVPESAVCLTTNFDCAAMFPPGNPEDNNLPPPNFTWIYVVKLTRACLTYKIQKKMGSFLEFCNEIAARDIPSGDVICAIKCERFFNLNWEFNYFLEAGVHYQLVSDIVWNPKLQNEKMTEIKKKRHEDIIDLINQKKDKYWVCPIPKDQEDIGNTPAELSYQEHHDTVNLNNFAIVLQSLTQPHQNSDAIISTALGYLKKVSNLNLFIPNLGITPLMHACTIANRVWNYQVVEFLLNENVDCKIKDSHNLTASDYCLSAYLKYLVGSKNSSTQNDNSFFTHVKDFNQSVGEENVSQQNLKLGKRRRLKKCD